MQMPLFLLETLQSQLASRCRGRKNSTPSLYALKSMPLSARSQTGTSASSSTRCALLCPMLIAPPAGEACQPGLGRRLLRRAARLLQATCRLPSALRLCTPTAPQELTCLPLRARRDTGPQPMRGGAPRVHDGVCPAGDRGHRHARRAGAARGEEQSRRRRGRRRCKLVRGARVLEGLAVRTRSSGCAASGQRYRYQRRNGNVLLLLYI